ncbi:MAG TPA: cytochrome c [Candidatus Limnocylindrales bacterium]|nr:cytochrome c [Candidatus Limnocylindrales bacterium]
MAIFVVVAVIVAGIAAIAIRDEGSPSSTETGVAGTDETAKELFATNCGSCHTLARAGTDGVVGPNLDELLGQGTPEGNEPRVLTAIENGINGRMPAGILAGAQAEEVASFVAREAGQ